MPLTLRISAVVVLAGYGTYLALKQIQPAPASGPAGGCGSGVFPRRLLAVARRRRWRVRGVMGVPRVLIVGTGSEAQSVLSDMRADGRHMREVVGFFPTSFDGETAG